jgi:hypothetical protein
MKPTAGSENIEDLINDLIALQLAQVADLREYAQATAAGEGTVQLERTLRRRELQRSELYRKFEERAFQDSTGTDAAASAER